MSTKKISHSGRFQSRYGTVVKARLNKVEDLQRKKQKCPFCKALKLKRKATAIWQCKKCNKTFASNAYYIEN
jgi:large subunit ribosomal protein L37Ae